MKAIYVISSQDRIQNKMFKIGKSTQTQEELKRRYKTALIEPIILSYIPVSDENKAEKWLHKELHAFRMESSEWFQCDLSIIMQKICDLQFHGKKKEKENENGEKQIRTKFFSWFFTETSFEDIRIQDEKEDETWKKSYFKLRKNNYWLSITSLHHLYILLEEEIHEYPDFWNLGETQWDSLSPIDMIDKRKHRIGTFYRRKIRRKTLSKDFFDFCIKILFSTVLSGKNESIIWKTIFNIDKTKWFFLSGDNPSLEGNPKMDHFKYVYLPEIVRTGKFFIYDYQSEKIKKEQLIYVPEKTPSIHKEIIPKMDKKKIDTIDVLMQNWIPHLQERKHFKTFGKNCILGRTAGEIVYEKLYNGTLTEPNNTLVSEFLITLLNTFFTGSIVRVHEDNSKMKEKQKQKIDSYGWLDIKREISDLDPEKTFYFPKLIIIYSDSSNLNDKTPAFYSDTYSWNHQNIVQSEKQFGKPNFVIVRSQQYKNTSRALEKYLPKPLDVMYEFEKRYGIQIGSEKTLWNALIWFLSPDYE